MAYQLVQSSPFWTPPNPRWKERKKGEQGQEGMGGERKGRGVGVFPGLHCEQDEECHHQTEETHSLRQSKAQDGVGEELLLQGGVGGTLSICN